MRDMRSTILLIIAMSPMGAGCQTVHSSPGHEIKQAAVVSAGGERYLATYSRGHIVIVRCPKNVIIETITDCIHTDLDRIERPVPLSQFKRRIGFLEPADISHLRSEIAQAEQGLANIDDSIAKYGRENTDTSEIRKYEIQIESAKYKLSRATLLEELVNEDIPSNLIVTLIPRSNPANTAESRNSEKSKIMSGYISSAIRLFQAEKQHSKDAADCWKSVSSARFICTESRKHSTDTEYIRECYVKHDHMKVCEERHPFPEWK